MEHLNKVSSTGSSVRSADIKVALRSAHLRTNEMVDFYYYISSML